MMFGGSGREGVTYTPASSARASRWARDGWEFWWKASSRSVSWTLVKRFRVRRETVRALAAVSSDEEMLATEEVLERCMVAGEIETA